MSSHSARSFTHCEERGPAGQMQNYGKSYGYANGYADFGAAFGGAGILGQQPKGKPGETCFGLRLNPRMFHRAMRMCSSSSHAE